MQKTENYNLNQWEPSDSIRRSDFNADNAAIDAALAAKAEKSAVTAVENALASKADASAVTALESLVGAKGNCKIAWGSYTGTGTYGEGNPTSLTFDFVPQVVMIMPSESTYETVVMLYGSTRTAMCGDNSVVSWSGNSVSWHNEWHGADCQLNTAGVKYLYMALG